ncbi:MAG: glycosyltransferase [Gammaproteobacteria bacterium]|nr:glycosyltransferase [Gammaproteobacteria bacterium]
MVPPSPVSRAPALSRTAINSISVVIPSFNRLPLLIKALESVYSQKTEVDEVIVVDDGSDDNTAETIEKLFPGVLLLRQPNLGVSSARNRGIKAAKSQWIALLDSDDQWLPGKISAVHEVQREFPQYLLIHSDEIWIRDGVRVNAMHKHRKTGGWIFRNCLPLCVISPSAAVINRKVFDQVGYFDDSLPACEDYDLWLRICHQMPVYYIDKALIYKYGGHADQLSRKFWGMDRFRVRALQNLLASAQLKADDYQAAEAMLIKKLNILLKGARKHANQSLLDEYSDLADRLNRNSAIPC